jgi:hypothetical protein
VDIVGHGGGRESLPATGGQLVGTPGRFSVIFSDTGSAGVRIHVALGTVFMIQ